MTNIIKWTSLNRRHSALKRRVMRRRIWRGLNIVVAVTTLLNISAIGSWLAPEVAKADIGSIAISNLVDLGSGNFKINGTWVPQGGQCWTPGSGGTFHYNIKVTDNGVDVIPTPIVEPAGCNEKYMNSHMTGATDPDRDLGGNWPAISHLNNGNVAQSDATFSVNTEVWVHTICAVLVHVLPNGEDQEQASACQRIDLSPPGTLTVHKLADTDGNGSFETTIDSEGGFRWQVDGSGDWRVFGTSVELAPGSYSVTENDITGYHMVGWTAGSPEQFDGNICEDSDLSDAATAPATIESETTTHITFCNQVDMSISGTKYYDWDRDNETDPGDQVLSGWTINLYDEEGFLATTTTDVNGGYSFSNLSDQEYEICEVLPAGWAHSPNPAGESYQNTYCKYGEVGQSVDFHNYLVGAIHGQKFNDMNGDGQWNEDIGPMGGWTVFIDTNGNGSLDQDEQSMATCTAGQTQDPSDKCFEHGAGWYWFSDLEPGSYQVCEVQQVGWQQTYPKNEASQPICHTVAVEQRGVSTCQAEQTPNAVETSNMCNFGNQQQATVTVRKNIDMNGDGDVADAGDVVNASDWTWDLNGGNQNYVTGSSQTAVPNEATTVSEDMQAGYSFVSVVCDVNEDPFEVSQGTPVSFPTFAGGHYTCTFTNARDTGTVTVNKNYDDNGDGQVDRTNPAGWTWDVTNGAQNNTGGSSLNLPTGGYVLTEDAEAGYTSAWSCSNQTSGTDTSIELSLSKGQSVTCTYTNTKPAVTVQSVPSLSITKSNSVATFTNPGTTVNYTVVVANAASATGTANNVVLTDVLPSGFTFTGGATTKSFNLGNIAPGGSVTTTYTVGISASQAAGTYTNTATADGDNTSPVAATSKVEVRVPQVLGAQTPELDITKTVNQTSVTPGSLLTYTVTISNTGDGAADNVVVTDELPSGLTYYQGGGTTKTWTFSTLAAGDQEVLVYDVTVDIDAAGGVYQNRAFVVADGFDPISAQADIQVRVPQVLGLATTGVGPRDIATFGGGIVLLALGFIGLRRLRLDPEGEPIK